MTSIMQAHRERVGRRIRMARVAAGLSHDRLAERVGTSRQHLIKLEKGQHLPRGEMLAKIAAETGKPESYFESDDDEEDDLPGEREFLEALRPLARMSARLDSLERLVAGGRL